MIRHMAVLAGLVSLALLFLLTPRIYTAEFSGQISGAPRDSDESLAIYKPDPHALYVQSTAKEGLLKERDRLVAAGISVLGIIEPMRERTDQDADYWVCRLGDIPLEAVSAARPGDVIRIRGRTLFLMRGDNLHWASHLTYEVQRGPSTMLFYGEGNRRFAALCLSLVTAPIALWFLGVAIAIPFYAIRRRSRHTEP